MGVSLAKRDIRFFSLDSRLVTRDDGPSDTKMMPGLPTTRCTRSWLFVTPTAGVTNQPLRSVLSTDAAAPSIRMHHQLRGGVGAVTSR